MSEDYTAELTGKPSEESPEDPWVIELVPKPDAPVVWGKVVVQVSPERVPIDIKYYDEKGELVRTMKFLEIKEMGGRTFPSVMRVEPADKPEEYTQISYEDMAFDVELDDRIFTLQSLKR